MPNALLCMNAQDAFLTFDHMHTYTQQFQTTSAVRLKNYIGGSRKRYRHYCLQHHQAESIVQKQFSDKSLLIRAGADTANGPDQSCLDDDDQLCDQSPL